MEDIGLTTYYYQLLSNPEIGFSIIETRDSKKKKRYQLWIDNYDGGEAFITEWDYVDDFVSLKEAREYMIATYGEVKNLIS